MLRPPSLDATKSRAKPTVQPFSPAARTASQQFANHPPSPPSSLTISKIAPCRIRPTKKEMEANYECEGCFGKRAGTAPSLRYIGRLQHSVLIKNGRSWRKHLSMSVSRGRSSKDTSLFRGATRQRLRKAVKGNNVKRSPSKTSANVRWFHLVAPTRMHPLMTAGHVTKTFFQATTGLPPKAAIAIVAE
jgi:hypothetical protein